MTSRTVVFVRYILHFLDWRGLFQYAPRGEALRWLGQAEYDLQSARHSAEGGFYASACLESQQTAGKAILRDAQEALLLAEEAIDLATKLLPTEDS